jgi:hypothetical protein
MTKKNEIIVGGGGVGVPHGIVPPWDSENKPRKDCKLCQSRWKLEAEELYDKTNSITKVFKFLTDDRQEDISYAAVRSHLKFHHESPANNAMIKEYMGEVEGWMDLQLDQLHGLRRAMAQIDRMLNVITAQSEGLPLEQLRKSADTMAKLGALLLNYRAKVEEMNRQKEGVTLVFNQLQVILQDEMKNVNHPEAKKVVSNVLAKLKDSVGHLEIEDED